MGFHRLEKPGLRGLTIAESFERGPFHLGSPQHTPVSVNNNGTVASNNAEEEYCLQHTVASPHSIPRSILAGVVMRKDLVIDDFVFGAATLGGDDATESILDMYQRLGRSDVRYILVSGLIISMYNIINMQLLYQATRIPIIGISYRNPAELESIIRHHFPDSWQSKIIMYQRLQRPKKITLDTACDVYVRTCGCTSGDAACLLNRLTLQGAIPEPVRVSRMLARAMLQRQPQSQQQ